ncbi:MAG: ABC transporter ATP-binding protein [Armatimonadota bacterium]
MQNKRSLLEVLNLKTHFFMREGVVRALDGVSFTIHRGKTLGIVGESGCGKSVTAQSILRIIQLPGKIVSGDITLQVAPEDGCSVKLDPVVKITDLDPKSQTMRAIRGGVVSMVFQEPMACFSPVHTIGDQVTEAVLLHQKVSKKIAKDMVIEMFRRGGMANPARNFDCYPLQLSGGMLQRATIAMALMCNPSLLIADEPTTALDVTTEAQILRLMRQFQNELHMAIMFITHDLGVIAQMADEVAVMYLGKIVETASVDAIFYNPKHPYLRALLRSVPRFGEKSKERLESIKGMVPEPYNRPAGCSFHPRCPEFMPGLCDREAPPYVAQEQGDHWVACYLYAAEPTRAERGDRIDD